MQEATAAKIAADEAAAAAAPAAAEVPPAAEAAPAKTADEVAAEAAAAEEAAAAAAKVDDKTAKDDDLPNFDDFELDPIALAPKELATQIETDPALNAALDANPELKNQIFANARLAAETAAFKEYFGSPAEAKVASEGHAKFASISSAMLGIKDGDINSVRPVMSQMLEASALRGPEGQLQYDDKGALITDGSVGRFLRSSFQQRMEMFAEQFVKAGDEDGQAAVDILMERAGLRTPSSASASEEGMSDELKAQQQSIRAERAELDRVKQEAATQVATSYNTTVNTWIDNMMDVGIGSVLTHSTGLNDFSRKTVEANIRGDLAKEIAKNPRFQDEMDQLDKLPYGPERQKQHKALATRYFQSGLAKVAVARLAEAGASLTQKQQAQADKSAARTEAARSEVRGAVSTVKSAPVLDEKATFSQVETDLKAKLGRSPSTLELMAENLKRKSQTAA
jgi:trimeric autotransporter adhesin